MTLYAGLMSGTSMDGIDVALMHVETHELIHGLTKPYSNDLKQRLLQLSSGQPVHLSTIGETHTLIGREFADAVLDAIKEAGISAKSIRAIGSHGQTVGHDARQPIPYTLQLGCAHTIAQRTGIPVVADFRTRDLVMGGQGAPFAPLYHQTLFENLIQESLAVVNIGGIANITLLTPEGVTKGWDIGPGNCLMDAWIYKHKGLNLDRNGAWASEGKVDEKLLGSLKQDAFFNKTGPKSIGKEYYSLNWLEEFLPGDCKPEDIQATLLELTSWSIAKAADSVPRLLLCGGGAHNTALVNSLRKKLPGTLVQATNDIGISPDYLEAMMFAWLASKTMDSIKVNLNPITGSQEPVLLGVVYPA